MLDFIREYQVYIMLAMSITCIIFVILLLIAKSMDKKSKIVLILLELSAAILLIFERFAYYYRGDASDTGYVMVRVSNFVVFLMILVISILFNMYLAWRIDDTGVGHKPKRFTIVAIIAVIGIFLLIISQFTNMYYYFDDTNTYHRGTLFIICYMIPIICLIIQVTIIVQYRKRFSKHICAAFVFYVVLPTIATIVQFFVTGVSFTNMSIALAVLVLYLFAYCDLNDELEIAHMKEMGELQEERNSMQRLFDQTATAFVMAIEKKDETIQGHSEKVAVVAKKIAEAYGKDEEECLKVYYAALLHDIGVVELPDRLIGKSEELTEEDREIIRKKPIDSAQILSNIKEFPYLKEAVMYHKERYDGSGYPNGLKGEDIPWISRVIAVADSYASMVSQLRDTMALPYQKVREEFIEGSGTKYDPKLADIMISLIDEEYNESKETKSIELEKELSIDQYRDKVSAGILIEEKVKKVHFKCNVKSGYEDSFALPSVILFDSYDARMHKTTKSIEVYKYIEFSELWFDGHYVSTTARNVNVNINDEANESHNNDINGEYQITMSRYTDHLSVKMEGPNQSADYIVALPDKTKMAYLGITGEHCDITDISVEETNDEVKEGDIRRIVSELSFINRLESDIPNTQVDGPRYAYTVGQELKESQCIEFHTMSLPSASLAWHCPYILIYHSDDGRVFGKGYEEYELIKLNGECSFDDKLVDSHFQMKKTDAFPGWEAWKTTNKRGEECSIEIQCKLGNVIIHTENLGIVINDEIKLKDPSKKVYASITGDQVALTDIRVNDIW